MAQRLPDASALGPREQLQSRGVVQMETGRGARAEMETGNALAGAGRALFEIGQRIQEREDRINYAKEKSLFLQNATETESSFDGDTDYKTFGARYNEKLQKAKQDALAKIQNPDMRAQFEADADLDIQQGIARMGTKAWGLERSNGVATGNEAIARNRELYLTAKDDAARSSVLNNTKQIIEAMKLNGYISPEEAEEMGRKSAIDYAVGRISVLPPDQRIAALGQKGGVGDFIPSDDKVTLLERAESELLTNARNAEWMTQQAREKLFNDASLLVEQTGGLSGISPTQWASMDKGQREALTKYARDIAEGNNIATDWSTYYSLKSKAADPATRKSFEREDLTKYRGKLGPTEYKELIGAQASLREGKTDKKLDGYRTTASIVDGALSGLGIDPTPKPGKTSKDVEEFRNLVDRRITALQEQTGKEVTNEEVRQITDDLIIEGKVSGTGIYVNGVQYFGDKKHKYQLAPGEVMMVVDDVREVPEEDRKQIETTLRENGDVVNAENILHLYNFGLANQ